MNSKLMVLTGLVITSFITALAASDLIPGLVMSFIVLAGGITATFFIALSQKRSERLAELNLMLKASQEINSQSMESAILDNLLYWIKRLIKCEAVVLSIDGKTNSEEDFTKNPDWEEFITWIQESKETFLFNRADKVSATFSVPEQISSLLAIPLQVGDDMLALVLLLNEQDKGFFNNQDREFVQYISRQATIACGKARDKADMNSFHLLILESLVRFLESQDPVFLGHAERVTAISVILGSKLGLDEHEMKVLGHAALLHDVGRFVNIPDKEIEASGVSESEPPANPDQHSITGADCLPQEGIFMEIRESILYHHERYDGSGYPKGLTRTEIPLNARIIAVADLYDAMTRLCPEEERLDHNAAIRAIKKAMGSLLDPLVVVVLEEIQADVKEIAK